MESSAYYEGALDGLKAELAAFHEARQQLADCRIWQWEYLLRDYKELEKQKALLYRELKKLEWNHQIDAVSDDGQNLIYYGCKVCNRKQYEGHAPDCTIDAALRAAEGR